MKKFEFLKKVLPKDQYEILIARLTQHKRFSSIEFEIIHFDDEVAVIRVVQDKSFVGNYADADQLVEIVHDTFDEFLAPRLIKVHPIPYIPSPGDIITPALIGKVMNRYKIKNKELQEAFGIHKSAISEWITGKRNMSKAVQSLFYYYFQAKGYDITGF